nr:dynein axonemal intermediate chain 1-like [Procambarus clarkii]
MMVRLSRILGRDLAGPGKGRPRVIDTRLKSTVKGRQVRLMKKMRTALGKKTKPKKPKKSLVWGKVTMETPIRPSWDLTPDDLEEAETEPEVQINLSCRREYVRSSKVVFCSSSGRYQPLVDRETLLDLLTLPSRVQLREDAHRHRRFYRLPPTSLEDPELEDVMQDSRLELEELYGGVVSKEELARIDSQPNPFSFSERVSQTTRLIVKVTSGNMQAWTLTPAVPLTLMTIARDPIVLIGTPEPPCRRLLHHLDLPGLATVATVLERMVTQNIYDDIAQDLRYWEDGSDEFHPLLGSLLPLWRFRPDQQCRRLTLADVSWSPIHPDIFAAAYASGTSRHWLENWACWKKTKRIVVQIDNDELMTLKVGRLLAAGRTDGTVMVYDIATTSPTSSCLVHSHTDNGKHLLSVTQVMLSVTQVILSVTQVILSITQVMLSVTQVILSVTLVMLSVTQVMLSVTQVILSVTLVMLSVTQVMLSVTLVMLSVTQVILSVTQVILSVTLVMLSVTQVILSVTLVMLSVTQVILSVTLVMLSVTQVILSVTLVMLSVTQVILSVTLVMLSVTQLQDTSLVLPEKVTVRLSSHKLDSHMVSSYQLNTVDFHDRDMEHVTHDHLHDRVSRTTSLATIIAFRPGDESVFLLGMDTGAVFQCSLIGLTHSLTCYPAHTSAVRSVSWNTHHTSIFLTCSLDWTVKVWLQHSLSPLVTLDLGVGVAGAAWSPYTSTVLVAVTEECRVHVYDLFLRQCRPLCLQNLSQRRRVSASCLAFSPFYPVVSVGGDRIKGLSVWSK